MGTVWSALLVGGGLAGALLVWLLRDGPGEPGKDADAEQQENTPLGEAAAPEGDQGGGGDGPSKRDSVTKPEHLQESNGHLISETKGLGILPEAAQKQQTPQEADWDNAREHGPAAQISHAHALATSDTGNSEVSRSKSLESHVGERKFQKGQVTPVKGATCFAEKLPSSGPLMDRAKEGNLVQLGSQDSADHEDWEMVSRHSSWGDIGLGGSLETSGVSLSQGMDCGRSTFVGARGWVADGKAMSSEPQQVSIKFQVHYTTSTKVQLIAVTGDHECLGRWNTYIPLHYHEDGLWAHSVFLPANTVVEWKFVLVENGEITRWEECSNRLLETGHEDRVVHGWWGIP